MESDSKSRFISRRKFLSATATAISGLTLAACGSGGGAGGAATAAPTTASGAPATEPTATTAAGGAEPAVTAAAGGAEPAVTAAPAETVGAAETAAPSEPAAEPTPAPTPTPVVLGTGSQKLTYWHGLGGADGATLVTMLQQYSQSKPDITISSETYGWDVFYQKLPTATAAGTPPDMGTMHSWGIPQFASQGILQDADTLFFQPGLIPKDDYPTALIDAITIEGTTYAVPFDNHGWINWVNTKVIKDAGLDPANLPKNGTEFIPWAQKIVVDENGKHADEDGFDPDRVKVWATHTAWQKFTINSTLFQFGSKVFDDQAKKAMLTDPKSVAAIQYWHDLIFKYHVVPPAVPGVASPGDLFKTNSIALMWDGTWNLNFFKDNPDSLAVMEPMFLNSLAPDGKQGARFDSHMFVVPVGVEDPGLAAAKDLIKWLSDNGETWANSGQVPARLSVQQKESVKAIKSVSVAGEQFAKVGVPGEGGKSASLTEILAAYEPAYSAILTDTTPVQQALEEANTQIQSILDRG